MKLIKLMLMTLSICLFISGCASTNKSHIFSPVSVSVSSSLSADIEVDMSKKLSGSASATYWMGLLKLFGDSHYADGYGDYTSIGKVKAAAAYNAISKGDGDILVSPSYVVKTTLYPFYIFAYLQIEVDVTGYEGKIKDIHP